MKIDLDSMVTEIVNKCLNESFTPEREKQDRMNNQLDSDPRGLRKSSKKETPDNEIEEAEGDEPEVDAALGADPNAGLGEPLKPRESPVGAGENYKVPINSLTPDELVSPDLAEIVDNIKTLRSGKSVDDEAVANKLNTYFSELSLGEKQTMLVFLSALARMVAGGMEVDFSPSPSALGINITEYSVEGAEEAEDTKTPIVVGERANVRGIRDRILGIK